MAEMGISVAGQTRASHGKAAGEAQSIDVALISTRLREDETPEDSFAALAKLWVTQDTRMQGTQEITTQHDFFEALRRAAGPNRKIGRLLIVAHGRKHDYETPYLDLDPPLYPRTLDLKEIRRDQETARWEIARCEAQIKDLTPRVPRMKTKRDKAKIEEMIRSEQNKLKDSQGTLSRLSEQELTILSVRDVMAPDAQIFLVNCRAAGSPQDAGSLVKRLGRMLLGDKGGRITAASGDVEISKCMKGTAKGRDTMDAPLVPVTGSTSVADVLRFLGEMIAGDLGCYHYIGVKEGVWVRMPVDATPKVGLQLGRLFMTGDTFRVPAGPTGRPATVKELTQFLMSGSGTFEHVYCPPHDPSPPPPASVDSGSAAIPGAGRIRYRIDVNPPNPGGWTRYNSNARLELRFVGSASERSASTEEWMGPIIEGTVPVAGPCTMHVVLAPPRSHGVYGGDYPAQTASFQLEFIPNGGDKPAAYGEILQNGDRVTTRNAKALLHLAEGTHILMQHDTDLHLVTAADGALRAEVEKGGVRVIKRPGAGRKLEFRFGPRVLTPKGTVFSGYLGEGEGDVQVEQGELEIEGVAGPATIAAGRQLDVFLGEIGPIESPWSVDDDFDGWPLDAIPFTVEPAPPLHLEGPFAEGNLAGWTWLARAWDPEFPSDAWKIEQGGLIVTTRLDTSTDPPRLWRGLTGDFDLAVKLSITSHPDGLASTRFFAFAAGSGIGRDLTAAWRQVGLVVDTAMLPGVSWHKNRCSVSEYPDRGLKAQGAIPVESLPVWLRLSRRDRRLIVASSPNAQAWTLLPVKVFAELPETLWIGLAFEHEPEETFDRKESGNITTIMEQRIVSGAEGSLPAF